MLALIDMAIKRLYSGNLKSTIAFALTFADNAQITVTKNQLLIYDTMNKLNLYISLQLAGRSDKIFLHKNRNGTIAVATGREPVVWPEDET